MIGGFARGGFIGTGYAIGVDIYNFTTPLNIIFGVGEIIIESDDVLSITFDVEEITVRVSENG